jgi:hypothetical protein
MEPHLPQTLVSLEHIADLDLYKKEKPYYLARAADSDQPNATNLQCTKFHGVPIHDVRGFEPDFDLATYSFSFVLKEVDPLHREGRLGQRRKH